MNKKFIRFLIFLGFGIITYLSHFLWDLPPYGSILNPILVVFTIILGLITFYWLIKIFKPKYSFVRFFNELLSGL